MPSILVYDDDCGFCTRAARFVARHGSVELVGFSDQTPSLREVLPPDYRECAHLVTSEGVYSCGEAMTRSLAKTQLVPPGVFATLRRVPGYRPLRERCYRWVARNRGLLGRVLT